MFFARWKNLGTGPDHVDWRRHFRPTIPWHNLPPTILQSQERVLSAAFDDGEEFKVDSLLSPENKSKLFRAQLKSLSTYDEEGVKCEIERKCIAGGKWEEMYDSQTEAIIN